jgi:hypothetical protein
MITKRANLGTKLTKDIPVKLKPWYTSGTQRCNGAKANLRTIGAIMNNHALLRS